ncbi:MAG: PKD domain-containing protein [Dehalococcoidia bacterium]
MTGRARPRSRRGRPHGGVVASPPPPLCGERTPHHAKGHIGHATQTAACLAATARADHPAPGVGGCARWRSGAGRTRTNGRGRWPLHGLHGRRHHLQRHIDGCGRPTYQWFFGDGTTAFGQSVAKTYTSAGTYSVGLVVTEGGQFRASATTTATITGTSAGTVSAGGPYSGTTGTAITMFATATSITNPQFQWIFGDGTSGSGQTVTKTYTSAGTFTVQVIVTNPATGQSNTASTTATITGGTLTVNAGGPYSGTTGTAITFFGTVTGATNPQYQWTFGDGTTGVGQTVTKTYTSGGTFTVTLTVTNIGTGQTGSATTTATVSGSALDRQRRWTVLGAAGTPITFFGSAVGATGLQYQWNFGDGTTGVGQTTTKTYTTGGTYSVSLTVTNLSTGQSMSATTTATITGSTLTVSAGGPYTGTPGVPITLFGTVTGATNPQYQWTFGDGTTGSGQTVTKTYTSGGTYTVNLAVSDFTTGRTGSATAFVTISGSGTLQVSAGGPYTANVGTAITLVGNATGSFAPQYQWTFGDGTTGTGQSTTKTYTSAGTFTVTLTATDTSTGHSGSASTTVTVGGSSTATEQIALFSGCNNLALTWPNGTAPATIVAAVQPGGLQVSLWKYENATSRFRGYSSAAAQVSDLSSLNRLDAGFICVTQPATVNRPTA